MQILDCFRRSVSATLLIFTCSAAGCSNGGAVVVDEAEFAKKVDTEERAQRKREEADFARQTAPAPQAPATGVDEERARAGNAPGMN